MVKNQNTKIDFHDNCYTYYITLLIILHKKSISISYTCNIYIYIYNIYKYILNQLKPN
jgi:hypothetical protein